MAVVPAHNAAQFIERTVLSAVNQTYPNLRVLVIDDGSTDETRVIVNRLAEEFPRLTLVSTPNQGVAAARNMGTKIADTDFVAFLDADDVWEPTKIAKQVAALERHSGSPEWAGCYALVRYIDADDIVLDDGPRWKLRGDFFDQQLLVNPFECGSNLLVRRDVALTIGGFNSAYAAQSIGGCEDLEFHLKLLHGHKVELVEEYLLAYRVHASQMSNRAQRMRLSEVAVIETVARTHSGHEAALKRGLAQAYFKAAKGSLKKGDLACTTSWISRSLQTSVTGTVREILRLSRHEITLAFLRLRSKREPKAAGGSDKVRFSELAPASPAFGCHDSEQSRRRIAALSGRWRSLQEFD